MIVFQKDLANIDEYLPNEDDQPVSSESTMMQAQSNEDQVSELLNNLNRKIFCVSEGSVLAHS